MIKISHQAGNRVPLKVMLVMLMLTSPFSTGAMFGAANSPAWRAPQASQQDKANACKNAADKKRLTGNDRKSFMQDCLNKAANVQAPSNMSNQDKMNACKSLADKKNLQGSDRRSFIKDCMNKANSK